MPLRLTSFSLIFPHFIFIALPRSLQIISWSIQQNIGARDEIKGYESYDDVMEFITDSLSQPCPDIRGDHMKIRKSILL